MSDERSIGEILHRQRLSQGLTLREVEKRTGIQNAHLSQIETGTIGQPSAETLYVLGNLYGLDVRDLMERAGHIDNLLVRVALGLSETAPERLSGEGGVLQEAVDDAFKRARRSCTGCGVYLGYSHQSTCPRLIGGEPGTVILADCGDPAIPPRFEREDWVIGRQFGDVPGRVKGWDWNAGAHEWDIISEYPDGRCATRPESELAPIAPATFGNRYLGDQNCERGEGPARGKDTEARTPGRRCCARNEPEPDGSVSSVESTSGTGVLGGDDPIRADQPKPGRLLDSTPNANAPLADERCHRCGERNAIWFAASPLWNAVMRGGSINGEPQYEDMVCARCFMVLAEEQNIATRFRVTAEVVNVELELVTPSGRVWDSQLFRWVEPTPGTLDPKEGIRHSESRAKGEEVAHIGAKEQLEALTDASLAEARRRAAVTEVLRAMRRGSEEIGGDQVLVNAIRRVEEELPPTSPKGDTPQRPDPDPIRKLP